ncbi:hypothetical protein VN97_g7096 [Penicillium thymicola]|uniref:Uncharacterized protein n=1 Tax=Penicillium thymicola TaxID=293382 RepID=A0AAI9TFR2_PENTH|nr:hypothetical protein VN97_g7096 [Penicillium thymicola]
MSQQPGGAPPPLPLTIINPQVNMRRAYEVGIINLRISIDRRQAMADGTLPFDLEEFEELSEQIWDTRVMFANQIRGWANPRDRLILAFFYHMLIGSMPDADGVIR